MAFSRVSLFRQISSISSLLPFSMSPFTVSRPLIRSFSVSAALSTEETTKTTPSPTPTPSVEESVVVSLKRSNRWKPMCLYYTQGRCTKMDDPAHLDTFNHNCSVEVSRNAVEFERMRSQQLDFFLVLDLEGKVEILEFPVLMVDAKTREVVDFFHRFVRPSEMTEQRINEYIEGKYGKIGVDRVWHDTAIPFDEVIQQFEDWMAQHHLWGKDISGCLNRAAFVTCGNWDLKTKVPQQCKVARMKLPPYFMEWINLKDAYLNFYKRRATGMVTMMRELEIPLVGSHHLGIDDTKNITRVLQHMLIDGALLQITARRDPKSPQNVEFLFRDRIR